MGLEDIFRALEEQAEKDSQAVLAEAAAHAEAILEEAEAAAARQRDEQVESAGRAAKAKSAQDLNSVRLEARKQLAGVKERAVSDVFDQALTDLGSVRSKPEYAAVFRRLADEALEGAGDDFVVLVDPADVEVARSVLADKGMSAEVRPDLSTNGGLVVAFDGGRVLRRNTFEDRLDKLRGLAQAEVAEILFT